MKILRFSIFIALLLSLLACERFKSGNGTSKTGNDTVSETAKPKLQPERVYHYVEPEENIAEIVWGLLKTQYPEIRIPIEATAALEEGYGYDKSQFNTIEFPSKTRMDYNYILPGGSFDNPANIKSVLSCYQTFDNSWIGIFVTDVKGFELDEKLHGFKVFAVEYKDGVLTDRDIKTIVPESLQTAFEYQGERYEWHFEFDSVSVAFTAEKYWPMKFNWNGKAFEQDPETVFMEKAIDEYDGTFSPQNANYYYFNKDNKNLNDYLVINGDTAAHFTFKDNGRLAEYTVMSPKYGFAQTMGILNHHRTVLSKPIAVGYPIQNVLDYEKTTHTLKDTTIVAGHKDGKYVITQQLAHNKYDWINVFIEFTANDESADIETIRVYSEDFVVTLESELQNNKRISEKTKSVFRAFDLDADDPILGEFNSLDGSGNGFRMSFKGTVKKVAFQTYNVDDGSTFVVVAAYYNSSHVPEIQFWSYQNDAFEEMSIDSFPTKVKELEFTDEGFTYTTPFEYDDDDPNYYTYYIVTYKWNGQTFEFESKDEGPTD